MNAVLAIVAMLLLGALPAWRVRMPGLAFLFGSGIVFAAMLAVALTGWRWALSAVLVVSVALSLLAFLIAPRRAASPVPLHAVDLLTAGYLGAYGLYATAAAPWHWDFWAVWGLKGRVFHEAMTIDWTFLRSPWNAYAHPDYPLLVPLNYTFASMFGGEWNDRWLGLLMVASAASLALLVRQLAAEELEPLAASAVTFAVTALSASQFIGLAEVPLIAFGTAGILLARRRDYTLAAVLLGLAASCKNEGLTLLAVTLLVSWRAVKRFWPAFAIVAPWLFVSRINGLSSELAGGSSIELVRKHLQHWPLDEMAKVLDKPWCWLAILAVLPLTLRRERFVYAVLGLQLAAVLAAYAVTPYDLQWHVATSWDRLSRQLIVPAAYAALVALGVMLTPGGTEVAEARSEQ